MPSEYTFGEIEVRNKQSKKYNRNNFAVLIKTAGMKPRSLLSEYTGSIIKSGKRSLSIAIATNMPKLWNSLKSLYVCRKRTIANALMQENLRFLTSAHQIFESSAFLHERFWHIC